jgi:hypothetical protein
MLKKPYSPIAWGAASIFQTFENREKQINLLKP